MLMDNQRHRNTSLNHNSNVTVLAISASSHAIQEGNGRTGPFDKNRQGGLKSSNPYVTAHHVHGTTTTSPVFKIMFCPRLRPFFTSEYSKGITISLSPCRRIIRISFSAA